MSTANPFKSALARGDAQIGLWMSLARRFKRTPQELHEVWQQWQQDLAALDEAADLDQLQSRCLKLEEAYRKEALRLRQARRKAAPQLSATVTAAMQGLGMAGGVFEVQISELAQPQSQGMDEVTFLVAGHPGASPKPLGKVASGGELSRISLAIAVTTSQLGQADTLIFDEVDSGVGGAVAGRRAAAQRRAAQEQAAHLRGLKGVLGGAGLGLGLLGLSRLYSNRERDQY